jgi:hypothetical protein
LENWSKILLRGLFNFMVILLNYGNYIYHMEIKFTIKYVSCQRNYYNRVNSYSYFVTFFASVRNVA